MMNLVDTFTELQAFYAAEADGKEEQAIEILNRLELHSYLLEHPDGETLTPADIVLYLSTQEKTQ